MKQKDQIQRCIAAASLAVALACLPGLAPAAQDIQVLPSGIQTNGDASATDLGNWGTFWITYSTNATCTWTFDPTMQSQPSIPGSIYCVCDWTNLATDINFGAVLPNGSGTWLGNPAIQVIDGTQYAYLLMDVYWTNVTGITSWATIGLMTPGYGMVGLTNNVPIPSTPGWQHLAIAIDPSLPNLSSIAGVMFYRWQNAGAPCHVEFWVDNVQLIARAVEVPPPTLTFAPFKATPGLNIQTASTDGEWDRQSVATVSTNYSWVGAGSTPVTYSMTVSNYPDTNYPYFQTQIYLASNGQAGPPSTDSAPDWGAPNCIFLQIQNDALGAGMASLLWKTNDPGDNAMFFNGAYNPIAHVYDPAGPNGTWTISFLNDTNATLTSPSGVTANGFFPDATALQNAFPQGSTVAFFGATPNTTINPGQGVVITEVKITGPAGVITPIDDHFTEQSLDTATWAVRAAEPIDITVISTNVHSKLAWTLPAVNFLLQSAPSVRGPWSDVSLVTNAVQRGQSKSLLLPDPFLPSPTTGYFRMMKPVATQLQVLLPGETNAPNTTAGKIGTPDPQVVFYPFDLTINLCDPTWHIISSSDTVTISSSDSTAGLPGDATLVNGTATISANFYFGTAGTWTVTATDDTNPAISDGTSTAITVH